MKTGNLFLKKFWHCALIACLLWIIFPYTASALKKLNNEELQQNSPALKSEMEKTPDSQDAGENIFLPVLDPVSANYFPEIPQPSSLPLMRPASGKVFSGSVCFKCHGPADVNPSDKTRKQWWLLIEENGHAIFAEIPWSTPDEKKSILRYLLFHAKKTNPQIEGIGLWNE